MGDPDELDAFENLATGEAPVPTKDLSCQWVVVPAVSPAAGQVLGELKMHYRYGVQVQVIRRDGNFVRFPDEKADVQVGDHLLLCGTLEQLQKVGQWLTTAAEPLALEPEAASPEPLAAPLESNLDVENIPAVETSPTLEMQH